MQSVPNLEKIIWGWILWFPSIDSLPNRPRQRLLRPSMECLSFRNLLGFKHHPFGGSLVPIEVKLCSYAYHIISYHIDVKQFQPHFLIFFGQKKIPSPSITIHGCRWCLGSSYSRTTTTIRRHLGASLSLGGTPAMMEKMKASKWLKWKNHTKNPAENCSSKNLQAAVLPMEKLTELV